ncbi:MAG TPA: tetratricopeptide repeat protein [Gaiellaceae bacterium]|jgi:tetratricopeptide (TPR) repeat protein|nr:tetratricopeptide repeat protein [Gaiellaceae bacterium]
MSKYSVTHIDEIPKRGDRWIPVRHTLGIEAFGTNAYTAGEGEQVISDHQELMAKHEELYVVVEGHATFTVDGQEIDAPEGTLVFVDDPASRRGAVAKQAGTTVLAVGAKPGEAYQLPPWEEQWQENQEAMAHYTEGRYDEAAAVLRKALETYPDSAGIEYNLACFESMAGTDAATVAHHLARAFELYPGFRDFARADSDLDPVKDDPVIASLLEEVPA